MPPDDDGPCDPPTQDAAADTQPGQSRHETETMTSPTHRHRNAEVDFKGEKRSNATHASITDPDAPLTRNPSEQARCCASWGIR